MDRKIAETLVVELGSHGSLIVPDKELFLNELVSTDVPESPEFYQKLPGKQQQVVESDRYHYLSLRKVIRNRNARAYQLSGLRKLYETIASAVGVSSTDPLDRNLRADSTLIEIMASCSEPFSLLGEFQSHDYDYAGETLRMRTRPVLVIPGVKYMKHIYSWEEANSTFEKEYKLLGILPWQKKINPQEYYSN